MPAPGAPAWVDAVRLLGDWLRQQGYRFITPTPLTHERVVAQRAARGEAGASTLRDVFGWSLPFAPGAGLMPAERVQALVDAGVLLAQGALLRSAVRVSTLGDLLLVHSPFPTAAEDSVFFGPDTYRFVRLVRAALRERPLPPGFRLLDLGCGSGAGGLAAFGACAAPGGELVLSDINASALRFAEANCALAATPARLARSDLFDGVEGAFDLIIANPPYLVDGQQRTYRNGGGALGGELSQRMVREGLARLRPGGRFVLYTGAAIVQGRDPMREAIAAIAGSHGAGLSYEEIDPDVFGEELLSPAYRDCDRIAAVGAILERPPA